MKKFLIKLKKNRENIPVFQKNYRDYDKKQGTMS